MGSPEVGAVEAGPEDRAVLEGELLHDIRLHPGRCCCRQRQKRHRWVPGAHVQTHLSIYLFHSCGAKAGAVYKPMNYLR